MFGKKKEVAETQRKIIGNWVDKTNDKLFIAFSDNKMYNTNYIPGHGGQCVGRYIIDNGELSLLLGMDPDSSKMLHFKISVFTDKMILCDLVNRPVAEYGKS